MTDLINKNDVIKIILDEGEFDGEMPDELWIQVLKDIEFLGHKKAIEELVQTAAKLIKANLINKVGEL